MGRFIVAFVAFLLLGGATLLGGSPDQGKAKNHKHRQASQDSSVAVHVVFTHGEVAILRTHYAPRYRALPPGLQKKVARGGQLPPGWQKKFEPFPTAVERQLRPLPRGYHRGVIDGHAVIFNPQGNVVLDVAVLF